MGAAQNSKPDQATNPATIANRTCGWLAELLGWRPMLMARTTIDPRDRMVGTSAAPGVAPMDAAW